MLNKRLFSVAISALLLASVLTLAPQFDTRSVIAQEEDLPRLFAIGSSDTGAKEVPLKGTRQNGDITAHYFPVHYYNIHARK